MLYPEQTVTRTLADLNGLWKFTVEKAPIDPAKPLKDYQWMAVPASYNDQIMNLAERNHIGYFWYETTFNVPTEQLSKRNVIHFGSVTQNAEIYVNGQQVGKHIGGFTPFEFEVSDYLKAGSNDLKVRLNNLLDNTTIPSATHERKDGKIIQQNRFDFYNYAGIHRKVSLYTTSDTYIDHIAANYQVNGKVTTVSPDIKIIGNYDHVALSILDEDNNVVATGDDEHALIIADTHRWQPLHAYLYRLKVDVYAADKLMDSYTQEFGVRTVEIKDHQFFINGRPFYFKGFGWHEDSLAHGKGENLPQVNLDLNIMKKIGANSFRTSHYPYSEETMRLADRKGFVVIDEVPAVGLYESFSVTLAGGVKEGQTWQHLNTSKNHKLALHEMIERDHDHPSVVMWSVANEPASQEPGAHEYFEKIIRYTKQQDPQQRPVTVVNIMNANADKDLIGDLLDVICLNRYYGWYVDFGNMDQAKKDLKTELEKWHAKFPDKPIMFTEFGADTVDGMHSLYHDPYSEEYQADYYKANFAVFDSCDYVQGEQLWNFADFTTEPGMIRIGGENRKGVFTRDRRPKEVVNLLKKRWLGD
ncbi:beta-glucuronidase [Limosilactobacillus sp. STM2_1]|uniref:Beta-glucuronidase n=1 Tax=Limosilactobacillus rudii TaxID=2759755 RepID=A0A7W3UJI7_9LACO|nr:beta-glucuronidase [Limosilactobacillus rudii]MBB1078689.1 beta-glucuronidase [Limosilactobacillus rudii]MBB1096743.1 beta-glucuronidase [Limosilactobacillus rudii]MCD7135585.1 beta-glucuronidase [Limosilactobacillus rudii]